MNNRWWAGLAFLALLVLAPQAAGARGLGVEVWTDRGEDAVYQPGDHLEVRARASEDTYLMVYEIDAEGYVRLLYPFRGSSGFIEGRRTYSLPPEQANVDLVVERGPVGQCYVVAIAARERFRETPWYLRPYDLQADNVGYEGMRDDEEGITTEGRIVGDPFVAMERIRRRVLASPDEADAFATGYATYYVHNEVRYPRYLCYDCHRPGRWAWWAGFDPYYTHCSVFDYRINWNWGWGPSYWFGCVPYYYYVVRPDCPPHYQPWYQDRSSFSSWDGWRRYKSLWGSHLTRFKSDPPPGYLPPSKFPDRSTWRDGKSAPPGFIAGDIRKGRDGLSPRMVVGRGYQTRPGEPMPRDEAGSGRKVGGGSGRPEVDRMPRREVTGKPEGGARPESAPVGGDRERRVAPKPRGEASPGDEKPREVSPREDPAPRYQKPRSEPAPRSEKPRDDSPRYEKKSEQPPAAQPREERGSGRRRDESSTPGARGGQRSKG